MAESEVIGEAWISVPKTFSAIHPEILDKFVVSSIPRCGKNAYVKGRNNAKSMTQTPTVLCRNNFKVERGAYLERTSTGRKVFHLKLESRRIYLTCSSFVSLF